MTGLMQSVLAFILMLTLVSCNTETKTESANGSGTLRLMATDAPVDYENVSSAKIVIEEIKLRHSGSGEKISVMSRTTTLDLLALRNGIVETLSEINIPAGKYDQVLLVLAGASVEMKDGRVFPLKVPSAMTSGLKVLVNPDITISTGLSTDVLLDFDLSQSFVATKNGQEVTGFTFKPVIRASLLAFSGTVSGQVLNVTDEAPVAGSLVTVQRGHVVVTTAITDSEGFFKVLGLPVGNYNITAEAMNFGSLTIDSVPVTAGNEVTTHFILTPVQSLEN